MGAAVSDPAAQSRWLDGYCLAIDISRYQTSIDWQSLKDNNISMVWAKCSEGCTSIDDSFAGNVQAAYDADIPLGAYHFYDPSYLCSGAFGEEHWPPVNTDPNDFTPGQDPQLLNLKKSLHFKKNYAISLDLERWWLDYADYYKNGSAAGKVTSAWIYAAFGRFADAVRKTWPNLDVYIYSRLSYLQEFVPQFLDTGWFTRGNWPIWTAEYYQPRSLVKTTWPELRAKYLPPNTANPKLWGNDKWDFWQFTGDTFTFDGIKDGTALSAVDISLYNGSQAALWQRLGFVPRAVTPAPAVHSTAIPTADITARLVKLSGQIAEIRSFFRA